MYADDAPDTADTSPNTVTNYTAPRRNRANRDTCFYSHIFCGRAYESRHS